MKNKSMESRTADVVLQRPKEITVGDTVYLSPPPTVATLILASEAIAALPGFDLEGDVSKAMASLRYAKDSADLGNIAAILILGAKALTETVTVRRPSRLWRKETVTIDRKAELAKKVLEELTPRQLSEIVTEILSDMQLADFFDLTTFLTGINMTRTTKVGAQTPSGQA